PETPPTDIYTLSLHDALPIYRNRFLQALARRSTTPLRTGPEGSTDHLADVENPAGASPEDALASSVGSGVQPTIAEGWRQSPKLDRKSTRLNSSHVSISYAVF